MTEKRYELVKAESSQEWEALHDMRRSELFVRREGVTYNTNHPDDHTPTHFPLVLKLDGNTIGTARLDLFDNDESAIRLVAIAKNGQRKGHGRILWQMFETFARSKSVTRVYVNSFPTAVGYYERLGFIRGEWNEPSGAPRSGLGAGCIQMTKAI